jgi:hypothetical protein
MLITWYYKIWVDALVKMRSLPRNRGLWKFYAMVFISVAMAVNLLLFLVVLQAYVLKHWFYKVEVHLMPGDSSRINGFLDYFILYLAAPLLINYLLIFRKHRYKTLIEKYPSHDGKWFARYFVISLALPFVLLGFVFLFHVGYR